MAVHEGAWVVVEQVCVAIQHSGACRQDSLGKPSPMEEPRAACTERTLQQLTPCLSPSCCIHLCSVLP